MSEWLDLMLEEISRKRRELREAQDELERRNDTPVKESPTPDTAQSK